ncbi:MAG TPA: hypothetical protein VFP54_02455 [Acidimicrobiales bacterium]|nr:hypothetical protein [Acidimicrobiales bacterium]
MRTVVELGNSNCTLCRDAVIDHLMTRPLVRQVHPDSSAGCLVVEHDHDSPAALLAVIEDDLRGWELADNGERVMVRLEVFEGARCVLHQPKGAGGGRTGR